jgi:signal peptidase I
LKDIGFTLLSEVKTIKVRAEGYSMYPSVKPGSIIFIEPFSEGEKPLAGEVIAWKKERGLVVHRLIRSVTEGNGVLYITRGDSTYAEDPPVAAGSIAGRVVRIEDASGHVIPASAYRVNKPAYRFNRFSLRARLNLGKILKIPGRLVSGRSFYL